MTEKFEIFELFLLDYQMVKCFRQIKTIFSDFGQFFELQITDLNVRVVKKHPVVLQFFGD